jgi:hypothetical protein
MSDNEQLQQNKCIIDLYKHLVKHSELTSKLVDRIEKLEVIIYRKGSKETYTMPTGYEEDFARQLAAEGGQGLDKDIEDLSASAERMIKQYGQ